MSDESTFKDKKKVVRRQLNPPPPINSISELIEIAQSGKRYSNIDMEMLWRILPHLIELNSLVGMSALKQSIFFQVIFYLQSLHTSNNDYLHTVILGPPGSGKCLGKDTRILMYSGELELVQNLQIGDVIMGDDSTPRTILSTCHGRDQMFKIQKKHLVNRAHVMSLVHRERDVFVDIPVHEYILDADKYRDYCAYYTSVVFPKCTIPDIDPYIMGFCMFGRYLIGDGDMYIDAPNEYIYEYFLNSKLFVSMNENTRTLEIVSTKLKQFMIDDLYKVNHQTVLRFFLGGIYDALSSSNYNIVVSDKNIFSDLVFIHNVLGLGLSYSTSILDISLPADKISSTFYSICLDEESRKYIPSFIHGEFVEPPPVILRREPVDIVPHREDDYYGFEIDGNGRFILENCMVTHNTSVAQIIGAIYRDIGILSKDGTFRIAKREDFVAEYLGQTAIKTKKLLTSCIGGVLFIDEVYALGPGEKDTDSFSKEAIDTLNVFLSENSSEFCCIVAGYKEEVKRCFFSVNPGLERRFQWVHNIDTYTEEELAEIFYKIVDDIGWSSSIPKNIIVALLREKNKLFKYFGGDMERLVSKCKMCHARRIFSEQSPDKLVITEEDFLNAIHMVEDNHLSQTDDISESVRRMYM